MHAIREATASPHKHFVFARIVLLRNTICRSGGTGRRPGLKIPWVVIPVPVRFRSAALKKTLNSQGFFVWKCKFQPIFVYGGACVSRHTRLVKKHIIDSLENL